MSVPHRGSTSGLLGQLPLALRTRRHVRLASSSRASPANWPQRSSLVSSNPCRIVAGRFIHLGLRSIHSSCRLDTVINDNATGKDDDQKFIRTLTAAWMSLTYPFKPGRLPPLPAIRDVKLLRAALDAGPRAKKEHWRLALVGDRLLDLAAVMVLEKHCTTSAVISRYKMYLVSNEVLAHIALAHKLHRSFDGVLTSKTTTETRQKLLGTAFEAWIGAAWLDAYDNGQEGTVLAWCQDMYKLQNWPGLSQAIARTEESFAGTRFTPTLADASRIDVKGCVFSPQQSDNMDSRRTPAFPLMPAFARLRGMIAGLQGSSTVFDAVKSASPRVSVPRKPPTFVDLLRLNRQAGADGASSVYGIEKDISSPVVESLPPGRASTDTVMPDKSMMDRLPSYDTSKWERLGVVFSGKKRPPLPTLSSSELYDLFTDNRPGPGYQSFLLASRKGQTIINTYVNEMLNSSSSGLRSSVIVERRRILCSSRSLANVACLYGIDKLVRRQHQEPLLDQRVIGTAMKAFVFAAFVGARSSEEMATFSSWSKNIFSDQRWKFEVSTEPGKSAQVNKKIIAPKAPSAAGSSSQVTQATQNANQPDSIGQPKPKPKEPQAQRLWSDLKCPSSWSRPMTSIDLTALPPLLWSPPSVSAVVEGPEVEKWIQSGKHIFLQAMTETLRKHSKHVKTIKYLAGYYRSKSSASFLAIYYGLQPSIPTEKQDVYADLFWAHIGIVCQAAENDATMSRQLNDWMAQLTAPRVWPNLLSTMETYDKSVAQTKLGAKAIKVEAPMNKPDGPVPAIPTKSEPQESIPYLWDPPFGSINFAALPPLLSSADPKSTTMLDDAATVAAKDSSDFGSDLLMATLRPLYSYLITNERPDRNDWHVVAPLCSNSILSYLAWHYKLYSQPDISQAGAARAFRRYVHWLDSQYPKNRGSHIFRDWIWTVFSKDALPFLADIEPRPSIFKSPNESDAHVEKRIVRLVTEAKTEAAKVSQDRSLVQPIVVPADEVPSSIIPPSTTQDPLKLFVECTHDRDHPSPSIPQQEAREIKSTKVSDASTWFSIVAPADWSAPGVPVDLTRVPQFETPMQALRDQCRIAQETGDGQSYRDLITQGKTVFAQAFWDAAMPFCKYSVQHHVAVRAEAVRDCGVSENPAVVVAHTTRTFASYLALHYGIQHPVEPVNQAFTRMIQRAYGGAFYAHVAAYQSQQSGTFEAWLRELISTDVLIGLKETAEQQPHRKIWQKKGTLLYRVHDLKDSRATSPPTTSDSHPPNMDPDNGVSLSTAMIPESLPPNDPPSDSESGKAEGEVRDQGVTSTVEKSPVLNPTPLVQRSSSAPDQVPSWLLADSPGHDHQPPKSPKVTATATVFEKAEETSAEKQSSASDLSDPPSEEEPEDANRPLAIPRTAKLPISEKIPKEFFL